MMFVSLHRRFNENFFFSSFSPFFFNIEDKMQTFLHTIFKLFQLALKYAQTFAAVGRDTVSVLSVFMELASQVRVDYFL